MVIKIFVRECYPFFNLRKHFCPKCGTLLERITFTKSVDPNSLEGQLHNFNASEFCSSGNVQFTWDEFRCTKCGKYLSAKKIRQLEKEQRMKRQKQASDK